MVKIITCSFYGSKNMVGGSERFYDSFDKLGEHKHVDFKTIMQTLYSGIVTKPDLFPFFELEGGILIDEYLQMYEELFKPDVIIRNSWTGGYLDIKTPQIEVFQDLHHTAAEILKKEYYDTISYNRVRYVFTDLQRKNALRCKLCVAVSEFAKEELKKIGIPCEKVIHHGIDLNHFKPMPEIKDELRKKYGIPLDKKVGLWIGRFHPQKGWHIMTELIKNFPNIYWICVFMEPIKHGPQLKNVLCLKPVIYEEMPYLYNIADFFILPSCCESFGLSSLEACACGVPIITQLTGIWWDEFHSIEVDDNIGLKDNVKTPLGMIVRIWDYKHYEDAVKTLLEAKWALEPRKEAEKFPIEKSQKEWKETIDEVLK